MTNEKQNTQKSLNNLKINTMSKTTVTIEQTASEPKMVNNGNKEVTYSYKGERMMAFYLAITAMSNWHCHTPIGIEVTWEGKEIVQLIVWSEGCNYFSHTELIPLGDSMHLSMYIDYSVKNNRCELHIF